MYVCTLELTVTASKNAIPIRIAIEIANVNQNH
jgi:hypothetical protein